jgi:hypothetical protein
MNIIKVFVRLVDGGLNEFEADPDFLQRMQSLELQGLKGKELIHHLITDDWGAPPIAVDISVQESDGKSFVAHIPYV